MLFIQRMFYNSYNEIRTFRQSFGILAILRTWLTSFQSSGLDTNPAREERQSCNRGRSGQLPRYRGQTWIIANVARVYNEQPALSRPLTSARFSPRMAPSKWISKGNRQRRESGWLCALAKSLFVEVS